MDKKELETYQVQLSQVEVALAADPSNEGLSSLRSELKELIDLTKAAIAQAEAPKPETNRKVSAASSVAAHDYAAGDEVLAKYSGDGSWYPARVTSVGGSKDNRVYSVVFKGYNNTELLNATAIKRLPPSYANLAPSASSKRKMSKEEEEEREKKKKKNEKKMEIRAQKTKEQMSKQATWQKFTKKAEKKGVNIAGVAGTSIFKTPDNPHGKGTWRFIRWCALVMHLLTLGSSGCYRKRQGHDRLRNSKQARLRS
jgi:survival of motor neuron-related-splicing factor 30